MGSSIILFYSCPVSRPKYKRRDWDQNGGGEKEEGEEKKGRIVIRKGESRVDK